MLSAETLRRELAAYLLNEDRMIVEPTAEMMQRFPLQTSGSDDKETAWLESAAQLLGGAVELRRPYRPGMKTKLAVKDRAVLFNYTQERTLEEMAKDRRANEDA